MVGDLSLKGSLENVPHAHIHSMCMPIFSYLTKNSLSLARTQRLPVQALPCSLTSSLNTVYITLHYISCKIQLTRLSKEGLFKLIVLNICVYIYKHKRICQFHTMIQYCPFILKPQILPKLCNPYDEAEFWLCNVQMRLYMNIQ